MSTKGKVITCKAAVIWEEDAPFVIEEVQVEPPQAGEVRIKIINSGVCHSDAYAFGDLEHKSRFPTIRGHEGAGIVESVGEGVTEFKEGDHVITLFNPQCKQCATCKHPKSNICIALKATMGLGVMPNGKPRFSCRGQPVYHFLGTSSFSQYTVVSQFSVTKINEKAPFDKVCLLGCGVPTGYGAALNVAKVEPGSVVAVWGLGAVGLAVVMGCKAAGASKIYGVDLNPDKFEAGKKFGLTHFVNPKDVPEGKTLTQHMKEITGGLGFDYTFECVGKVALVQTALESTNIIWGTTVVVGVDISNSDIKTPAFSLVLGRKLMGTFFGGWHSKDDVPKLVDRYMKKDLMVDEFISHNMTLDQINDAFAVMLAGKSTHSVLKMHDY